MQYELAEGEEPRSGYVRLAPGARIAIQSLWLHMYLSYIPNKRPEKPGFDVIKRLIDGFYEPWDLNVGGGTSSFRDTAVFTSLRCKLTFNF